VVIFLDDFSSLPFKYYLRQYNYPEPDFDVIIVPQNAAKGENEAAEFAASIFARGRGAWLVTARQGMFDPEDKQEGREEDTGEPGGDLLPILTQRPLLITGSSLNENKI
jgi:hypothetical protein